LDKDKRTKKPILYIKLYDTMKDKFAYATYQNISKPLPFIFENKIISAPIVGFQIEGGEINVTGLDEELINRIVKKVNK